MKQTNEMELFDPLTQLHYQGKELKRFVTDLQEEPVMIGYARLITCLDSETKQFGVYQIVEK